MDNNECVTLIEENPGMVSLVPAGAPLAGSAWMTVLVPASFSGPGAGEFVDVPADLLAWASTVDAVNASSIGPASIGGLSGTEYELEVNTSSLDTVFCSAGQCTAVMQPQVAWFRDNQGSLEIDTASRTRLTALDADGTTIWIWRQAPRDDETFFAKTDQWLSGWSFGGTYQAVSHDGAFGPVEAGPVALASGAVVSIPEPGWTIGRNTAVSSTFLPPGSPPYGVATDVIQVVQAINRDLQAVSFEETATQFIETADVVGWSVSDAGPGTIGDFESRVFTTEGFGQSIGPAFVLDGPSAFARIHLIQSGDKAWMVYLGGSTVESLDQLEVLASALLTDATLPEPTTCLRDGSKTSSAGLKTQVVDSRPRGTQLASCARRSSSYCCISKRDTVGVSEFGIEAHSFIEISFFRRKRDPIAKSCGRRKVIELSAARYVITIPRDPPSTRPSTIDHEPEHVCPTERAVTTTPRVSSISSVSSRPPPIRKGGGVRTSRFDAANPVPT
ncbi:hypothetical protein GQR58_029202 [Nymphon striatum]|nr:hypothetical protein GQR58_029202 [Nymphon striatum]